MKKGRITGIIFSVLLLMVVITAKVSVSAEESKIINLNSTISESGTERNAILYQVNVTSAGKLSINFKHANLFDTKTFWTIEVLADDLQTVLQTIESKGVDTNLTGYSLGVSKGTYYIKVWARKDCGDSYSDAFYQLTPKFKKSSSWEIEYNSTTKTSNNEQVGAKSTSVNKKAYGTICDSNDIDYFKVKVKKNGYISLNITHKNVLDSEVCWRAELVNARTEIICSVDSKGTQKSVSTPKIGVTPGTYYIKITPSNNYSKHFNTADYAVKLNFKASNAWEKEYNNKTSKSNNSMTNANKLTMNKYITGTLSSKDDIDYYNIKLKKKKTVKLIFNHKYKPKKNSYWLVTVYNSKLEQVSTFKIKGCNSQTVKKLKLKKGSYYIKVSCGAKYSKMEYKLKVK